MIDARNKQKNDFYAVFFDELSQESIIQAVNNFDNYFFQYSKIHEYSKNWDKYKFINQIKKILN